MRTILLLFTVFISVFFLGSTKAFSAEVYFSGPGQISTGEIFEMEVKINTDGQSINLVEMGIGFDESVIEFSGYKDEFGVVKLWVNSPQSSDGVINMVGIVPGGVSTFYSAAPNGSSDLPIVSLIFKAKKTGTTSVEFLTSKIFMHDGKGSLLSHSVSGKDINVIENNDFEKILENELRVFDPTPPDVFNVDFIDSGFFSRTPPMIIFSTRDSGSGVKEYKIKKIGDKWESVQSPYPVNKGFFAKSVYVRAYDFGGNFTESSAVIPGVLGVQYWSFAIIVFLFCLGLYKVLKYKL